MNSSTKEEFAEQAEKENLKNKMDKERKMQHTEIIKKLKSLSDPKAVEGMAIFGIAPKNNYGVPIPNLRKIAKETGTNHKLAQKLWKTNIRDARILASMIDDPNIVTKAQMEKWVENFNSWDVCDQVCMNLFRKTSFAHKKAVEWSKRKGIDICKQG